jgi:hypothetical protein
MISNDAVLELLSFPSVMTATMEDIGCFTNIPGKRDKNRMT